jgi:hypothetical protein
VTSRDDPLEFRLQRLWQVDLPSGLADDMDRRLSLTLNAPIAAWKTWRPSSALSLRRGLLVGLVAAVVLATAAYASGMFDGLIGQNPGWQQAWEHSTELNLPVTVGANHIVVVRGYADANRILVGLTSPDIADLVHDAGEISLTDPSGRSYMEGTAISAPEGGGSIGLFTFLSAADLPAGDVPFTLSGSGASPWQVTFRLPVQASHVMPGSSLSADEFQFTLHEVTMGASVIRVALDVALEPGGDASRSWAPITHLVHNRDFGRTGAGQRARPEHAFQRGRGGRSIGRLEAGHHRDGGHRRRRIADPSADRQTDGVLGAVGVRHPSEPGQSVDTPAIRRAPS